jgi:hypothetical protein
MHQAKATTLMIPGPGPHTIVLTSDLPVLTGPLTVDGYSQPGARAATSTSPAELMIAIDASGALRGVEIGAGVELRGLAIHSAQAENVFIEGGGNVVAGNHIGTNLAGDAADQYDGCNVTIYSAGNLVGGDAFADRNVIARNAIGTNLAGGLGLGNGQSGIRIDSGYNQVGEEDGASMNTIAYNGDDGVTITATATGNTVVRNLIFVNGTSSDDLGIDLGDDGVTANDGDDVDTGANELLNHPLITAANAPDGTVAWKVDGLGSSFFLLEFYASTLCDGSASGEGQRYLGSVVVQTNSKGRAAGLTATTTPPVAGDYITMTATRKQLVPVVPTTPSDVLDHGPLFTSVLLETSEFSPCRLVN